MGFVHFTRLTHNDSYLLSRQEKAEPDLFMVEGLNMVVVREHADILDLDRLECNDVYAVRVACFSLVHACAVHFFNYPFLVALSTKGTKEHFLAVPLLLWHCSHRAPPPPALFVAVIVCVFSCVADDGEVRN